MCRPRQSCMQLFHTRLGLNIAQSKNEHHEIIPVMIINNLSNIEARSNWYLAMITWDIYENSLIINMTYFALWFAIRVQNYVGIPTVKFSILFFLFMNDLHNYLCPFMIHFHKNVIILLVFKMQISLTYIFLQFCKLLCKFMFIFIQHFLIIDKTKLKILRFCENKFSTIWQLTLNTNNRPSKRVCLATINISFHFTQSTLYETILSLFRFASTKITMNYRHSSIISWTTTKYVTK